MKDLKRELSKIDLAAMVSQDLGQPRRKSGRWCMWLCPFHPDRKTPSLGVNRENGSWHCFGCLKGGDAISWLCTYRNLSFAQALAVLGLAEFRDRKMRKDAISPDRIPNPENNEARPPSVQWQKRGLAFVEFARDQLWNSQEALVYLHKARLLEDATIRHFGIGFNPSELWDSPKSWGISDAEGQQKVWLPKGYVIPCFVEESLWYIKIRQVAGEPKYVHVRGSVPALFGTASLMGAPLILLTEGEFDCMLAWQCLKDVAGVATLGSANQKLDLARWAQYLLPAEEILAVLDQDAAGKLGAQALARLSAQICPVRIPSLCPSGKDITDYIQAGGDLWEWLKRQLRQLESKYSNHTEEYV